MPAIIQRLYIFIILCTLPAFMAAQGVNTTFGQNRLPYKDMQWQVLSSENVDAFYYEGGLNLAEYAQLTAEQNISAMEDLFSYRVGGKVEIVIFNTIEDIRQSNTGLKEQLFNVGGYTYVVDNKVIAWYNGTHADFEEQIKRGIAEIILTEMIYGNSLQERVQYSSLLFLPSWFFKGLTSYAANPWDTKIDSKVRDGILTGKYKQFNLLDEEDAIVAGHSIWNYIAHHYGQKYIADILYFTRLSKGFEGAYNYTLGITSRQLIDDWLEYYTEMYKNSEREREVPRKLLDIPDNVSGYPHTQLKTHPNGKKVAFVMNRHGLWQVKIFDKHTKNEKTVFKGGRHEGYQVINYEYPVLAWDPKGRHLGVIYFEKGKTKLVQIDKDGKITYRHTIASKIDQVLSFDFADDNTLLLSAIKNGQTDLYLYNLQNDEITQLTDDIYDDLWPRFNTDQTQLIFSSNRPYDTMHFSDYYLETLTDENNFDVFLYDYAHQNNTLKRVTNTPYVNEIQPVFYIPGYLSFVSDISGIYNAYACKDTVAYKQSAVYMHKQNGGVDTFITTGFITPGKHERLILNGVIYAVGADSINPIQSIEVENTYGSGFKYYPLTNYKRNILFRDLASTDDAEYNLLLYNNRYQIFETYISPDIESDAKYIDIVPTEFRLASGVPFFYGEKPPETTIIIPREEKSISVDTVKADTATKAAADSGKYYFQTDFPEDFILNRPPRTNPHDLKNIAGVQNNFFTAIFPDYYVAQFDNSILNTYYHLNTNGAGPSVFANMFIMLQAKVSLSDLMGNHRINAGVRYPFSLNGSDYFMEYENRKHRINWEVNYFRQSRRTDGVVINRQLINQLRFGVKLPFNETVSLRLHAFGRQDRSLVLGTDSATLRQPDTYYNWAGTKAELVFDNTKNIDINLPFGSRFKVFAEVFQNVAPQGGQIINLGADYRKYVKLHNKIIWATRFTVNASVGPDKVQYYIGGVENWIGPSYNSAVSRGEGKQYIFQSQANSLRGFKQNIRNGSNYALLNLEVRFPVASYITQKPVRADYLRNFMLVPFIDVGTAWYGTSPFKEQPYNTTTIQGRGGGYVVTVTTSENPIVGAMGFGARTRLLGYYLRIDFAWGVQNGRFNDHMTQLALGYDF